MRIIWVILLFGGMTAETACGQSFYAVRRERNLIGSFGTGNATYFGDLKNPGLKLDAKLNLNFGLQYFLGKQIAVRTEINWFQLSGADKYANSDRRERNLSFTSNNYEANFAGMFNLFQNRGGRFYRRVGINFYAFAGVGLLHINPTTSYMGKTYALQPLETEGKKYSKFQFVIPYGLGVKIKQGPYVNICIEGGYRTTFTDYLDDVSSKRYPDPATLKSDLARALSDRRVEYYQSQGKDYTVTPDVGKRGNPKYNDGYFLLNVKLEYYLPYSVAGARSNKFKIFNPRRKYNFSKRRYNR